MRYDIMATRRRSTVLSLDSPYCRMSTPCRPLFPCGCRRLPLALAPGLGCLEIAGHTVFALDAEEALACATVVVTSGAEFAQAARPRIKKWHSRWERRGLVDGPRVFGLDRLVGHVPLNSRFLYYRIIIIMRYVTSCRLTGMGLQALLKVNIRLAATDYLSNAYDGL